MSGLPIVHFQVMSSLLYFQPTSPIFPKLTMRLFVRYDVWRWKVANFGVSTHLLQLQQANLRHLAIAIYQVLTHTLFGLSCNLPV